MFKNWHFIFLYQKPILRHIFNFMCEMDKLREHQSPKNIERNITICLEVFHSTFRSIFCQKNKAQFYPRNKRWFIFSGKKKISRYDLPTYLLGRPSKKYLITRKKKINPPLPRPTAPVLVSEAKWSEVKVRPKRFFDFPETWHTCRLRWIKFRNFRKSWKSGRFSE